MKSQHLDSLDHLKTKKQGEVILNERVNEELFE